MKSAIITLLFLFIANTVHAQYNYVVRDGTLQKVETAVVSEYTFSEDVDPAVFTPTQLEKLVEDGKLDVTQRSELLPVKLLPVIKRSNKVTVTTYRIREGMVTAAGKKSARAPAENDFFLSFFMLYLPLVLCTVVASYSKDLRRYAIFAMLTTAGVIVGIFAGAYLGISAGGSAGGFAGMFAGASAGASAGGFAGIFAGIFAGGFAGAFAGIFAGMLVDSGADTAILWQYVLVYAGICFLAFLYARAVSAIKSRRGAPAH